MRTILISGSSSSLAQTVIKKLDSKFNLVLLSQKKITIFSKKKHINIFFDFSKKSKTNLIKVLKKNNIFISAILHFNGIHDFSTINTISLKNFRRVYEANCFSFIELVQLLTSTNLSKELKSIITISSVSSVKPSKGISLYASSKAALDNLVKSFALELVKKKIRVNSILLGHIHKKGMSLKTESFLNNEQLRNLESLHPLGLGKSEDLFHAIEFLIDNKKSRWITGTNLVLDGGYLI